MRVPHQRELFGLSSACQNRFQSISFGCRFAGTARTDSSGQPLSFVSFDSPEEESLYRRINDSTYREATAELLKVEALSE